MMNKKFLFSIFIIGICMVFCFTNIILDNNTTTNNPTNSSYNSTSNVTYLTNSTGGVEHNKDVQSSYNQYSSNSNSKNVKEENDEFTAEDAMKEVEKNVKFSDNFGNDVKVRAGYPVKDDSGCWWVPCYDKKTGEYLGSVGVVQKGGPYFGGHDSFYGHKTILDNYSYDEAMEAKLGVEKYVLNKNEIAGHPIYKDSRLDSWLVPIFDKKTKKFVGSVYIYKGGQAFVLGPDSYFDYKKIVSGKTNLKTSKMDKSNSNETLKTMNDIGSISTNISNNPNSKINEQINLNKSVEIVR